MVSRSAPRHLDNTTAGEMETSSEEAFATVGGKDVFFSEDWDTGIGGGLWSTGAAQAKYFENHRDTVRKNLKGVVGTNKDGIQSSLRALELGSGNGYLSVCLVAIAGDLISELVVTDLADHLPLINKTLEQNTHLVEISSPATLNSDTHNESSQTKAFVTELKWGVAEGDDSVVGTFDFIFGSDLAYRDYLHAPLISSLDRLSHENTVSLIGVTMADTKPSFFQSLKNAGFRYERLSDYLLEPEFRGTTFGLFVIQRSKLKPMKGQ